MQDISKDLKLDIFGWKLEEDEIAIVIVCAIAVIILISITIVFIIWYCCFCRKKLGIYILLNMSCAVFLIVFLFVDLAQNSDEEQRSGSNNIPG